MRLFGRVSLTQVPACPQEQMPPVRLSFFFCVETSQAIYGYFMHIVVYKQEKEVVAIPITDNGLR